SAASGVVPVGLVAGSGQATEATEHVAEPPGAEAAERAERPTLQLGDLVGGVPEGGHDQVLQHLDLVGVDDLGRDPDRGDLAGTCHRDGDDPAPRPALDHLLGGLSLRSEGLLGGGEQLAEPAGRRGVRLVVGCVAHGSSSISSPPNSESTRSTPLAGASSASCSSVGSMCSSSSGSPVAAPDGPAPRASGGAPAVSPAPGGPS